MKRVGRPTGLIGYDTDDNISRRAAGQPALKPKIVRPRTIVYVALIVAVSAAMTYSFATRRTLGVDVMHDRNPIFVSLSDGSVRNVYTVRVLNPKGYERGFKLSLEGLPQGKLAVMGEPGGDEAGVPVTAPPDQTLELRVTITVPPDVQLPPSTPVSMILTDAKTGETVKKADYFKAP
jgi:polyferredoxin